MDKTNFDNYLQDRYFNQLAWYDKKASKNQKIYIVFQWGLIVLAALTPVLVALHPDKSSDTQTAWFYWIPIISSAVVAILASGLKTFRYQENWISYRATCETLRKEYFLYQGEIDEYGSTDDKERLFIERIETIISRETKTWVSTQKEHSPKKKT